MPKQLKPTLRDRISRQNPLAIAGILLVAALTGYVGYSLIRSSFAAGNTVSIEAESGAADGGATIQSKPNGASNDAVRFGGGATPAAKADVLLSGRANVWDMAFLPDGAMLFTERRGGLSVLKDGQARQVSAISDIDAGGEGGLLGLAADPQFAQNRHIYACFNSTAGDVRVVRWTLPADLSGLSARKDIITGITANQSGRHSGCRLAFGPDGYLWVGTGDAALGTQPQQPKSLNGKILRVDREGVAAPGNLGGEFDARVYSYGHRNTQGLAFFPAAKNGVPGLSAEHGSSVDDEVNELRKGNFGWAPPNGYNESGVPMTDKQRFPDAVSAIWSSGSPTQAPSGIAIINNAKWQGWNGSVAVAMLRAKHLKILRLDAANKVTKEERLLVGTYGRLRAVVQGPDGNLYVSTDNGNDDKIIRLTSQ